MCPDDDTFETMAPAPVAPVTPATRGRAINRDGERRAFRGGGDGSASSGGDRDSGQGERSNESPRDKARPGLSLKGRAIGYLSRREHSRLELQRKLAPHADPDGDPQAISNLLDELEREGWLSDARFAQSLVHRRGSRMGARRVLQELRQHGVDESTVAEAGNALWGSEFERANEVWQKKFGTLPKDAKEFARQYRFLASRGFPADCVRRILGDVPYGD